MTTPHDGDHVTLRYREASAQDERGPSDRVREAVHTHARMLAAANVHATERASAQAPAANQSRWRVSMFASVLLAGLAGLLMLQFEHGTPREKELVRGAPVPSVAMAPPASPALLPESALEKDKVADADSVTLAPKSNTTLHMPPARARATPPAEPKTPSELSAAKRSAPEPFPATQPTDARVQAAPRQDADTQAQPGRRMESKLASVAAAPAAEAPAPAAPVAAPAVPAPSPAAVAAQSAPAIGALAEASPSNRAAGLSDGLLQKDSRAVAPQTARQSALPRGGAQSPPSALHEAARSGRVRELERQLATDKTQLNAADAAGRTPLMLAAIAGHADAVQRLLAAGANRALVDHEGLNALQHARRLGLERIAAMLEAGS